MGDTVNLESIFRELQEKNQAAKNENIKAQTQLEESVKRVDELLADTPFIHIDCSRLNDKEYALKMLENIRSSKETLKSKFLESADKARRELEQ